MQVTVRVSAHLTLDFGARYAWIRDCEYPVSKVAWKVHPLIHSVTMGCSQPPS